MQTVLIQAPTLDHYLSPRITEVVTRAEARYLQQFDEELLAAWGMYRSPYRSAKLLPPTVVGVYLTAYFSAGSAHIALAKFMKGQWSAPLTPEDIEALSRNSPASFPYDVSKLYWRGVSRDLTQSPMPKLDSL